MSSAKSISELEAELRSLKAQLKQFEAVDTERNKAQAALEESEEKYRNTMDASLVGIYVIQDLIFKYANPFFASLFGYEVAELVDSRSPVDLVVEEQQEIVRRNLLRRASGEPGRPYEVKCQRKDGSNFYAMVWGKAITFDGRPASVGTMVDITEQKVAQGTLAKYGDELEAQVAAQTEKLHYVNERLKKDIIARKTIENELRASEEKLRALINASKEDVVILLNSNGCFDIVNERAATAMCSTVAEIIGKPMTDFLPQGIAENRWSKAQNVLANGTAERFEDYRAGHWYDNNFCPVLGPQGTPEAVAIFARDITDRKALDLALSQAKENAEKANLAKSRFLAAANHDLRQPLHAMALFLGALSMRNLEPSDEQLLRDMQAALHTMEELLNSLLDISKLEAGVISPDAKDFLSATLFHHLFTQFNVVSKDLGVKFRLSPCNAILHTDPTLLARIIQNFVSNAIRHTRKGKILVGCRRLVDGRRIEVWDQGEGIPDDQLAKIFEEFHQIGEPARNQHQGLGLGLAIAKKISDLLDLKIDVRSEVGKGTVFAVEVPTGKSVTTESAPAENSPTAEDTLRQNLKPILLVEDNIMVQKMTVHLLQLWGYKVVSALTAHEALNAVSEMDGTPSMAIIDYRLPGDQSGVKLYAELCSRLGKELPGILVTGDSSVKRLREVQACGLTLIHKPINTNELHRLIVEIESKQSEL